MTKAPPAPFQLSASDRVSQTWSRIERHLFDRLEDLRKQNDGDIDERKTAKVRGQIAEVKRILALADEPQEVQVGTLE